LRGEDESESHIRVIGTVECTDLDMVTDSLYCLQITLRGVDVCDHRSHLFVNRRDHTNSINFDSESLETLSR
jgi:hypothetical protein